MPDDVLPEELPVVFEPWLLPEFEANHIVSPEIKAPSQGGFSQQKIASNQNDVVRPRLHRAMSVEQLAQIKLQAEREGFHKGRASGYEKGYTEGEQRAKAIVEQLASEQLAAQQASLSSLISEIVNPLAQQRNELKQTLTELVKAITQKVCEREWLVDNSSIASVVALAIDALPATETDLTLFLHPKDLAALESIAGFIQPEWQLCARDSLELGDCLVESENSLVDFRRSTRFQTILDSVFPEAKV